MIPNRFYSSGEASELTATRGVGQTLLLSNLPRQ